MCLPSNCSIWSIAAWTASWVISASAALERKLIATLAPSCAKRMAIAWPIPELLPVISTFLPRIPCIVGPLWTFLRMNIDSRCDRGLGFANLTSVVAFAARSRRKRALRPNRACDSDPFSRTSDDRIDLGEVASACRFEDDRVLGPQIAASRLDQVIARQKQDPGRGCIHGLYQARPSKCRTAFEI